MRSLAIFLFMAVFIYFYTYIIGGDTSMLMLYMFIISPVISVVLVYPAARRIDISVKAPTAEVEKDSLVEVSVCIRNKTFLPIPFIDIDFIEAENLAFSAQSNYRVSLGSFQTRTITMNYIAKRRGISSVGIKNVTLRDYLGFFRFYPLRKLEEFQDAGEITVLPRIFNMKSNIKIMMSLGQANVSDDTGASSTGFNSWSGEPGYEFREYQAGDSLHKVHWKLTAKKEVLMVRKDEGSGIPRKSLVVDPYMTSGLDKKIKRKSLTERFLRRSDENMEKQETGIIEEKLLEAVLSIANLAVKTGREIEVWLLEDGQWAQYIIKDIKNIHEIQYKLAVHQFESSSDSKYPERMPISKILENRGNSRNSAGGELIVFTGCPDAKLIESINLLSDYRMTVDMLAVRNDSSNIDGNHNPADAAPVLAQGKVWELKIDEDLTEAFL